MDLQTLVMTLLASALGAFGLAGLLFLVFLILLLVTWSMSNA